MVLRRDFCSFNFFSSFSEKPSLKKLPLLWQGYFFFQTLVLDLLKLLLCWFSLKFIFGSLICFLLKWSSMKIWGFSYLGTTLDFALFPCGKTPPKPPLHLVINLSPLSQLIQTSFGFYSNYFFLSKQIWKIIWSLRDFQSKYSFSFEFWPQTNSPG